MSISKNPSRHTLLVRTEGLASVAKTPLPADQFLQMLGVARAVHLDP